MAESFFDRINKQNNHTPDVLSCLANLSNDEVFTPPEVVNRMLDILPEEIFKSKETTFLDPACKTGVFLREIAKRLLKNQMPGYEEKVSIINSKRSENSADVEDEIFLKKLKSTIEHIFKNQLFGIGITELTSLLSRRSLYCSKYPNGPYSIVKFDNAEGNIRFRKIEHTWENGKCIFCGASKDTWDRDEKLETHAYEFIHKLQPEEIFNMKFDVIIGNPPYQLDDGGNGSSAKPIYHLFIEQAKKLNPRYISMIIPSRWFSGGKGLDEFRTSMIQDTQLKKLVDYPDSSKMFPGVEIKGGVNYFLWEKNYSGECEITTVLNDTVSTSNRNLKYKNYEFFIRFQVAIDVLEKIEKVDDDFKSFDGLVSSRKPFGLSTTFKDFSQKKNNNDDIKVYANKKFGYISRKTTLSNKEWIDAHKIFISRAYGAGEGYPHQIINNPFYGEPGSISTETYLLIGPLNSQEECDNILSYMKTKFFRFLVMILKSTQDATSKVYRLVPTQDFSKEWTDAELYKKYNLTQEEINFIESMIRPME